MRSKDYFGAIRSEALAVERSREMLERMMSREDARSQRYDASSSSRSVEQPDLISRRIDFEHRLDERIEASNKMIDEALEILYGIDGRGGLSRVKGARYADAVCMHYCQAETWADVADVMQCSQAWARKLCDVAFEYIDALGFAYLKNA